MSFMLLHSQEAYNKYYYKSLISSEDMRNGIFNNQTESEKQWVKDWRQQLKDKANLFKKSSVICAIVHYLYKSATFNFLGYYWGF